MRFRCKFRTFSTPEKVALKGYCCQVNELFATKDILTSAEVGRKGLMCHEFVVIIRTH